jgi:glycosyltransferase involved in cell wall biosynthesis
VKPLVSILIPAFNAEALIEQTLQSALDQTWPNKEIIVVDDGSKDQTATVARRFEFPNLKVVVQPNQGAASARNHALSLAQGDYIQWLDADDLLNPEKVELQMRVALAADNPRLLFSCPWAAFYFRPHKAKFRPTALHADLTPVEWLRRKMAHNLHMQTATWLTSRALAEAAGPWDLRMLSDDDGEYFSRVLLASDGVKFVDQARVFYRTTASSRLSFIGSNPAKIEAMFLSIQLHIARLLSCDDSPSTRQACLTYLNTWRESFYPERPDLLQQLESMAAQLGGKLAPPEFRWKYAWMERWIGPMRTKKAQLLLPQLRATAEQTWERAMHRCGR